MSENGRSDAVASDINTNGDPGVDTQRAFIVEVSSAEGVAIDVVAGDFYSNSGSDEHGLMVVGGFAQPA